MVCACVFVDFQAVAMIVTDFLDTPDRDIPPLIRPLSLPALAALGVDLCGSGPSPHRINLPCSVFSAPVSPSVTILSDGWPDPEYTLPSRWVGMDKWLSMLGLRGVYG